MTCCLHMVIIAKRSPSPSSFICSLLSHRPALQRVIAHEYSQSWFDLNEKICTEWQDIEKWMMEPGYGKWFQSAFCVFSLQYDMIDNLTYLTLPSF